MVDGYLQWRGAFGLVGSVYLFLSWRHGQNLKRSQSCFLKELEMYSHIAWCDIPMDSIPVVQASRFLALATILSTLLHAPLTSHGQGLVFMSHIFS